VRSETVLGADDIALRRYRTGYNGLLDDRPIQPRGIHSGPVRGRVETVFYAGPRFSISGLFLRKEWEMRLGEAGISFRDYGLFEHQNQLIHFLILLPSEISVARISEAS